MAFGRYQLQLRKKAAQAAFSGLRERSNLLPQNHYAFLAAAFLAAGFSAALVSAAAAFFSAVLAAPSPVALATALLPNF
jgi:hypothetical protein